MANYRTGNFPLSRHVLLNVAGLSGFAFFALTPLQSQRVRDLVNESPFFPPTFQPVPKKDPKAAKKEVAKPAPPPPQIQQNLEFKGFFKIRNVWRFSIFDKRTSKSTWVRLEEKADAGFTVLEFDPENQDIVVEDNGHKETLSIKSPSGTVVPVSHIANAPKPAPAAKKPTPTAKPKPAQNIPRRRIVTPRPN